VTMPVEIQEPLVEEVTVTDKPWIVIVWNDPVNLMSYVVYVFQKLFGFSRKKATKLMHQVN
jgi:ATP-dependent Clp protease adaptor protein ClpS